MLAFLITLILFIFLTLFGKAVMEAVRFHFSILRSWLVAPCIGFAVVELLTLALNQAGLPVKSFATWLTLGLVAFSGAVFWRRRPVVPGRQLAIFGGIALFSLVYTCWPMFIYGLKWVGYMNGDMGTYCLGALRVMNYGFYRMPELKELTGTDYSQYWWFHHAAGMFRCGSDIFLAWFASVAHLEPLRVSMPVLAALNLAQLSAGAALVLSRPTRRRVAVVSACLLAASPFFMLGVVAQVLAQVGGLVLVFGICCLCMRPFVFDGNARSIISEAILISTLVAALCSYYPEVLPFPAFAIAGYYGYTLIRKKQNISHLAALLASCLLLILILARQSIFTAIGTLLFAIPAGILSAGGPVPATDFDTMLDPSLFASIFGFQTYFGLHSEPLISISIFIGIVLLLGSVIICLRMCFRAEPFAFLLGVMLVLGLKLFFSYSAFGVFKLAMYIQPVLLVPLASVIVRAPARMRCVAIASFAAASCVTAAIYVGRSTTLLASTSVMLPKIEEAEVHSIPVRQNEAVLMDSVNMVGDFVFAAASIGTNTQWADIDVFRGFANLSFVPSSIMALPGRLGLSKDYYTPAKALRDQLFARNAPERILGHLVQFVGGSRSDIGYLGHRAWDPWHSSNNDPDVHPEDHNYFEFERYGAVSNYLVLLSSDKGAPHFRASAGITSRWPTEPDFYRPSGTIFAIGRHLLFEVIHPVPGSRVRISLSRTVIGGGRTRLPEGAIVKSSTDQKLDFAGSGAANVISPPISFFEQNGHFYFALDFGINGDYFNHPKTGLMRLFNRQIRADHRPIVALTRDIALIRDSAWSRLSRPRTVKSWPADLLRDPGLEFSGIYEDGWISDHAYMVLGSAGVGDKLVIRGSIPAIGPLLHSGNQIHVLLNGDPIYDVEAKSGHFEIWHTFTENRDKNRIDFCFGRTVSLPSPDDRPVSAQLNQVSILQSGRLIAR